MVDRHPLLCLQAAPRHKGGRPHLYPGIATQIPRTRVLSPWSVWGEIQTKATLPSECPTRALVLPPARASRWPVSGVQPQVGTGRGGAGARLVLRAGTPPAHSLGACVSGDGRPWDGKVGAGVERVALLSPRDFGRDQQPFPSEPVSLTGREFATSPGVGVGGWGRHPLLSAGCMRGREPGGLQEPQGQAWCVVSRGFHAPSPASGRDLGAGRGADRLFGGFSKRDHNPDPVRTGLLSAWPPTPTPMPLPSVPAAVQ